LSLGATFKVSYDNDGSTCVDIGYAAVSGNSPRHWTIKGVGASGNKEAYSYIAYNATQFGLVNQNPSDSVYLGTDGLTLGKNFSLSSAGNIQILRGSIRMGNTFVQKMNNKG